MLLCAIAAAALDICAFVLIMTAYAEKRTSRKNWAKMTGGMVLEVNETLYPLSCDEVIIGRHASADVRLPDPSVSRYHAILTFSGNAWTITDMDSKSGVYVNGMLVKHAVLRNGDVLSVGASRLIFRRGEEHD